MSLRVLFFVALCALGSSALEVTNCGGQDVEVSIPACSSSPCELSRGSSNNLEVTFTVPDDSKVLTTEVKGHIGPLWIPWPGFDNDACSGKNIECPVKKGSKVVYKHKFEVASVYPAIKTTGEFTMKADGVDIFCFRFPVTLV